MLSRARILPAFVCLSACISSQPPASSTADPAQTDAPHAVIEDSPAHPSSPPSADEARAFAAASNAFGGDLYRELAASQAGNFTMSPASISTALAMTWVGARGKTRDEMTKVLHLGSDPRAMTRSAAKLLASLDDPKRSDSTLAMVSRLFGEKTLAFEPEFLSITKSEFGAPLAPVDFKYAAGPARVDINQWVAKETRDKIKELLPDGSITPDTRLVLTNAVYLHADWESPFMKEATSDGTFHVTADKTTDVPMMHQDARVGFVDADGVRVIDMPYKGGDLAMTILLPDDAGDLGKLEQRLSAGGLDALVGKEQPKLVRITLPKFTVATGDAMKLSKPLKALGMPDAFEDGKPDFSGVAKGVPLYIAEAYHKAFVAINEQGTEAAAATAVVIATESAAVPQRIDAELTADHPFLFAIRDTKTGLVLFVGRVVNPAS